MVKIIVCVGSSCHLKGSRQIIEKLQSLIDRNYLKDKIELCGALCMENCLNGVSVTLDGELFSLNLDNIHEFFESQVMPRL